jgi:ATP-binding cassette subfamily B protein
MNDLRRVLNYLRPYAKEAFMATILLTLVVGADLSIPRLVQVIIDEGVVEKDAAIILRTGFLMIGASILSALFMVGNTIYSVKASRGLEADLRKSLFRKIQSFSFGNLDDFTTGQLLTRLTSDLNQVRIVAVLSLRMLIRAPLMFIGSLGIMYATNATLTNTMLILLPITVVLIAVFIRIVQPLFKAVQERLEYLNQVLQENLVGVRVVKAFVRRNYEYKRFDGANSELFSKSVRVAQLLGIFFPLIMALLNLGTVAIVYYGGIQVFQGTATVGQIMAFMNYVFSTMFPVLMLAMMAGQISIANASATRIIEVLDSRPEIQDKPDAVTLNDLGATGSGKSSLIHLIPRFYDATSGKVVIDGIDVKDIQIDSLRKHIGVILQETVLFSGTVRDNIRYGRPDAEEKEVIEAARAAQAHEFIMNFPDGYDTLVGQRGVNLSGGQKQRIAIARALLVKPKILILDDSTSSVDVETEIKIEQALEGLMKDRTSFVIAQRISTVLNADKILVLDRGRITAEGNHTKLMETSPIYQEIFESQLGAGVMTK